MKKVLSIFISSIILISSIGIIANADANNLVLVNEETQYLGQGYFATVSIYENFVPILYTTAYTKSGSKVYTMRNKNGDVLWTFTLNGSFKVDSGKSSTCTSSNYSKKIINDSWSLKSASTSKTSNKAIGDATFQSKVLFIVTDEKSCHLGLICDKNGNLS